MTVRILIVDDSEIFRTGLRAFVEAQADWEVCGEARDGQEAIQKTRQLAPNLIVMDLAMPVMSGIDATRQILREFPSTPIVLLTLYITRQLIEDAHNLGIRATVSTPWIDFPIVSAPLCAARTQIPRWLASVSKSSIQQKPYEPLWRLAVYYCPFARSEASGTGMFWSRGLVLLLPVNFIR